MTVIQIIIWKIIMELLKKYLEKYRYINWVFFFNFIKMESEIWFNKLYDYSNKNITLKFNNNNPNILNNIGINKDFNNIELENLKNQFNYNSKFNINSEKTFNNILHLDINEIVNKEKGIINLSYHCFINSSLQVLKYNTLFIGKFLNKLENMNLYENSVSFQFYEIWKDTYNINLNYIDIGKFLLIFGYKHLNFGDNI